jgi:hypothetical protein
MSKFRKPSFYFLASTATAVAFAALWFIGLYFARTVNRTPWMFAPAMIIWWGSLPASLLLQVILACRAGRSTKGLLLGSYIGWASFLFMGSGYVWLFCGWFASIRH